MMKGVALLLLGVAGAQAQTTCTSDANGDGEVGVDGASSHGDQPAGQRAGALLLRVCHSRSQISCPCLPSTEPL